MSDSELQESINKLIFKIAKKWFNVETIEQRGRDSLDFYDVHINAITDCIEDAFLKGYSIGKGANSND